MGIVFNIEYTYLFHISYQYHFRNVTKKYNFMCMYRALLGNERKSDAFPQKYLMCFHILCIPNLIISTKFLKFNYRNY